MNSGVMVTGAVHPPESVMGSVGDSQLAAPSVSRGGATIVDLNMTIPKEHGGLIDIEMTGATSGVGNNQALQGLSRGCTQGP